MVRLHSYSAFCVLGAKKIATGTYETTRRWPSAAKQLSEAHANGCVMPIIFGDASADSGHLFKWGILDRIEEEGEKTTVWFSQVRDLGGYYSNELEKDSDGELMSRDVRRGHSVVVTPPFLTLEKPAAKQPEAASSMTGRVFIANFGVENDYWPTCRDSSTIATFEDEDLHPFWLARDRKGYIDHCLKTKKTAAGLSPTVPVASRWYNLAGIISSTEGDVWIHREKDDLWWTTSLPGGVDITLEPALKPTQAGQRVYILKKPARAWSNKSKTGTRLMWPALHARAREFLFTEGTLQQLSPDNTDYALALIEGTDLKQWHESPAWKAKADVAKRGAVTFFDAKRKAVARMMATARDTVAGANGQQVQRTVKNKELRFATPQQFEQYIKDLLASQEELCAITGLRLQFDGEHDDEELLCSLDRIDSDGHYERKNLQVVCRFINRWKNNANNEEFKRLIELVRKGD